MKIQSLTHTGLGRAEDGTMVPRTLPLEEVEVTDDGVRIVSPSADRVSPPCRHYKSCGGCAMQHASDAFVAAWKASTVERALSAQGIEATIAGTITSPIKSRRRAKLAGRRTKKGTLVGFHARASDTLVEVPDCQLLAPELIATLPALNALTALAASRKAEVAMTVSLSVDGPDVHIQTEKELTTDLRVDLAQWANQFGIARLVWVDEPVVTIHPPRQDFGGSLVVPPPGAFLQATKHGEKALQDAVSAIVGDADKVVDLFAGSGTFTLPLARKASVYAVEGVREMMDALDRGWRSTGGLHRVSVETRDLFRRPLLPDELNEFDAIVIDPPRAGAEAQVAEIAESKVATVAMVSCNPVTFARDARTLIDAGFTLGPVTVVDQFRWSHHTEVVAAFTRN
ncbi:class I SAM-dependent RNA methyltransferase [Marivivens donghaensis]|uniref:class I SAM-dependent RNA methyltransferase n=1 Tax=Marivivens donghaensis TaxID=1699413 RepID=UPI00201E897B|nr:RsmD family RNA methyltransferase [Marivivens donghaensis]MCL7409328.1 RsmD family RNA methyltransferase [Marivivens donghaensis]MDN3702806.1 RsmD family RNA methyltransferase [Marivivens donghaensis]